MERFISVPKSFSEVRDDEGYRLCDSSAECECKGTTKIAHGNGLSPDLWGSCPLTCETAWGKTAEDDNFRKNSEKHLQKIAPLCAILRRRKKAHSKICSTHLFVVILQRHSFRRVMVFRYLYHEETPKNI